ncbi:hypothetical protein Scep_013170 [Stephania cephalantha]|uniref:GH16 domain-containing protein n=1 Tax=Stephania cephalantha TaxID=152367 RepID=A0AAP0P758_9MAGN
MEILGSKFVVLSLIVLSSTVGGVQSRKFDELFQASWALDHVINEGEQLKLKLDSYSGAGFASKSKYMYGKTTVQIKLVEGDSAGTVTAFYMSSEGPNHHEFDFEFLGNTSGEPVLVQTNIYIINGVGNREQRNSLWFDPTKDFHSYSILWNKRQVIFMVDETPIRVYTNREKQGIPFPKEQAMGVYSSIWNADDWATQGRVKTDWSHAPFVSSYRGSRSTAVSAPAVLRWRRTRGGVVMLLLVVGRGFGGTSRFLVSLACTRVIS